MIPVAALRTSASAGAAGPVVALSGEADATTAAELRETLATQLDTGARLVTVDASGLSFLDSASRTRQTTGCSVNPSVQDTDASPARRIQAIRIFDERVHPR